ncbi:MAG: hypothetical protein ACOYW9_12710 [Deinococcota bacterium]|uniref:hypothetical protein n=1 Tax=Allomeiothermus silvanus TaxID=52022 RepID=UPI0023F1DE17|nr:hypothetical protein [Allomeiothermus silvanus]
MEHLDSPLYYLGRYEEPILLRNLEGSPALIYTDSQRAQHLQRLTPELADLQTFQAVQWREKEELLKALLLRGIEVYTLDFAPGQPLRLHAVRAALAYVQSHKRQNACL